MKQEAASQGGAISPPRRGMRSRIPRGALLLSAVAVLNVVLGFAREGVIAYYFGTSAELDAFLVAYTLPRLIVMQAVQVTVSIILPLYIGHLEAGRRDAATALLQRWFRFLFKLATIFCLAMAALAPVITYLIGPGLSAEQRHQAANWLRMLLPYVWVITVSGVFKVVLDQNRRFFMPAMTAAFVSASVMLACALHARSAGVVAMIPGYTIGGVLAFLFQWRQSHRHEPKLITFAELPTHIQLPLLSGGIMVINSFAQQANTIIDRAFASSLPEGSIAALNYASSILMVPQSIFSAAIATALFPLLSEMVARGAWRQAFRTTMTWTSVVLLVCALPVAALAIERHGIVALLFQRGQFGHRATEMTSTVLLVLSFMLIVTSSNSLVLRLLLAQQQLRLILVTTLLAVALKIVINIALVSRYGLTGIAVSSVVAVGLATLLRYVGAAQYTHGEVKATG